MGCAGEWVFGDEVGFRDEIHAAVAFPAATREIAGAFSE
jgi:hypothetical protein